MDEYVKTKLLVTIADKDRIDRVLKLFKRHKISYSCSINGKGTASSSLLSYFGLDEVKKSVVLTVIPCTLETKIMYDLHYKLELYKPGNGICFSTSITSASRYLSNIYQDTKNIKEEYSMINEKEYELIVLIASEGYASVAMDAAKRVGAGGGTLINGIGLGSKEATKFLGITIEPEKDVVLIITPKEEKRKVMEEITKEVGLSQEGRGILFAVPVDHVVGLSERLEFLKN
jgi:nitrogen regulatory protein PII